MLKTKYNSPRSTSSRSRIAIRGSNSSAKIPMAKASKIPAGKYRSEIVSVNPVKTAAGDDAVEVIYNLLATDGSCLKMREIIPLDSWAFEKFCDALIAAGLTEDDDLNAAVGITEEVVLAYPDPRGLGHFSERHPVPTDATSDGQPRKSVKATANNHASSGGDFDDYIDEDDEDDED